MLVLFKAECFLYKVYLAFTNYYSYFVFVILFAAFTT